MIVDKNASPQPIDDNSKTTRIYPFNEHEARIHRFEPILLVLLFIYSALILTSHQNSSQIFGVLGLLLFSLF